MDVSLRLRSVSPSLVFHATVDTCFKPCADPVGFKTQSGHGQAKIAGKLSPGIDFRLLVLGIVLDDHMLCVRRQSSQAIFKTFAHDVTAGVQPRACVHYNPVTQRFKPARLPAALQQYESGHTVTVVAEILNLCAAVDFAHNAIDRNVNCVGRRRRSACFEESDQLAVQQFLLFGGTVGIGVEDRQKPLPCFAGDGRLASFAAAAASTAHWGSPWITNAAQNQGSLHRFVRSIRTCAARKAAAGEIFSRSIPA
jgi:hypothetical protein